jgi:hypothetical protein
MLEELKHAPFCFLNRKLIVALNCDVSSWIIIIIIIIIIIVIINWKTR